MNAGKTFHDMTDAELKVAAIDIVRTSIDEDEVKRRLKSELNYPYSIAITSHQPTDDAGREARAIVRALGGLTLKSGAMVMVMMHGHRDTISF